MTTELPPWRVRVRVHSPNPSPDEAWLAQVTEAPLYPEREIVDAHHHLWDRHGHRYLLEEYADDIGFSGRNVVASVYVQCRTMYRADGSQWQKPLGEVEFVRGIAAQARSGHYGTTRVAAAIVACADLCHRHTLIQQLDALIDAGGGLVRGIRMPLAAHTDERVISNPVPVQDGVMLTPDFLWGAQQLAQRGLSLDVWVYQSQLAQVAQLAAACPGLRIVVNHMGGPLGVGPYATHQPEHFEHWRQGVQALAVLPNVVMKLGGFAMPVMGLGLRDQALPPTSKQLAVKIKPFIDVCLESFGATRCLFESNFPVDKGGVSYAVLWNAFCRVSEGWSDAEIKAAFSGTAKQVYRLGNDVCQPLAPSGQS